MKVSPKKRRREDDNVLDDMPHLARRKIVVQSQEMTKSERVRTLSVKNTALSKLTERSPAKFMTNAAMLPKTKMLNFSTAESLGRIHPHLIWSILTQAKGAPKDERTLCITLLREVAELNRVMTTKHKEEKIENSQIQQAIKSSTWPRPLKAGQIPLIANVLKLFKSELNITAPSLSIQIIEQVCRDRQNVLRRSRQGILRCKKCKEAGKVRAWCKICWGSQICRHGRQKRQCKDCGGSGLCIHGRRRSRCKDCGGSGLCMHKRRKGRCKLCGGNQICQHGRRRTHCKLCGGNGLCSHGRQKSRCKECATGSSRKTNALCKHRTPQSDCKHCATKCPACKGQLVNGKCKNCRATQMCKHGIVTMLCEKCMGAPHCIHALPCTCCAQCAAKADTPNGISWVWGGASVGRVRGVPTICGHGKLKSYCRACGGSPICKHGRDERYCRECGGSGLCKHGSVPAYCKECHGDTLCVHGFKRHRCKTCCMKTKRQKSALARKNLRVKKAQHPSICFKMPKNEKSVLLPKPIGSTNGMRALLPTNVGSTLGMGALLSTAGPNNKLSALLPKPLECVNEMSALLSDPILSTKTMHALLAKSMKSTTEIIAMLSKKVGSKHSTGALPLGSTISASTSTFLPKPLESTNCMSALVSKPLKSTNGVSALVPKPVGSINEKSALLPKPVEPTNAMSALPSESVESTLATSELLPKSVESTHEMSTLPAKRVESADAVNGLLLLASVNSSKAGTPVELSYDKAEPQKIAVTATAALHKTPAPFPRLQLAMSSNPIRPPVQDPICPLSSDPSHPHASGLSHPLAYAAASQELNRPKLARISTALASQLSQMAKRQQTDLLQAPKLEDWSQSKVPLWSTPPRLSVIAPGASSIPHQAHVDTLEPLTLTDAVKSAAGTSSYDRDLLGGASFGGLLTQVPIIRRPQLSSVLAESPSTVAPARDELKIRNRRRQLLLAAIENSRSYAGNPMQSTHLGSLQRTPAAFGPAPESLYSPALSACMNKPSIGCFLRV